MTKKYLIRIIEVIFYGLLKISTDIRFGFKIRKMPEALESESNKFESRLNMKKDEV